MPGTSRCEIITILRCRYVLCFSRFYMYCDLRQRFYSELMFQTYCLLYVCCRQTRQHERLHIRVGGQLKSTQEWTGCSVRPDKMTHFQWRFSHLNSMDITELTGFEEVIWPRLCSCLSKGLDAGESVSSLQQSSYLQATGHF